MSGRTIIKAYAERPEMREPCEDLERTIIDALFNPEEKIRYSARRDLSHETESFSPRSLLITEDYQIFLFFKYLCPERNIKITGHINAMEVPESLRNSNIQNGLVSLAKYR